MNPETVETLRAILAGWFAGVVVGLVNMTVLMILLVRERDPLRRFPGLRVSLPIFGVILTNVTVFGWTLIGILLGAVYSTVSMPAFSAGVIAVGVFLGAAYAVVRGRGGSEAKLVWPSLIVATVLFASVVPILVEVV